MYVRTYIRVLCRVVLRRTIVLAELHIFCTVQYTIHVQYVHLVCSSPEVHLVCSSGILLLFLKFV